MLNKCDDCMQGVYFSAEAVNHLKSGKALSAKDYAESFGRLSLFFLLLPYANLLYVTVFTSYPGISITDMPANICFAT